MSVLLELPKDNTIEIYNDLNGDLVNFWRVLRDSTQRNLLCEQIALSPYSRQEYAKALKWRELPMGVERTLAWLIINIQSVGTVGKLMKPKGSVSTSAFSTPTRYTKSTAPHVRRWTRLPEKLIPLADRVQEVIVEFSDWQKIISRYDSPKALFYVDPPYVVESEGAKFGAWYASASGTEMPAFGEREQMRLLDALCAVRGKVALSGYDIKMYREVLRGWRKVQKQVTLAQGIMAGGRKRVRYETLWLNYPVEEKSLPSTRGLGERGGPSSILKAIRSRRAG